MLVISSKIEPDKGGHPSEYPEFEYEASVSLFKESISSALI
jgi:hypothetical protein